MTPVMRAALTLAAAVLIAQQVAAWPGRSSAERAEFRKTNPCPATGRVAGACRGWEIDHIEPLKCGGADAPANMQWLTVEAHKAKTAREAKLCRKRHRRPDAPPTSSS